MESCILKKNPINLLNYINKYNIYIYIKNSKISFEVIILINKNFIKIKKIYKLLY